MAEVSSSFKTVCVGLAAILGAPFSYAGQRIFAGWGALDPLADMLGEWLKINASTEAVAWAARLIFYIIAVWLVFLLLSRLMRANPKPAESAPDRRGAVFEGNVAFGNGRDGFSLPEGFQGTLKGNTAFGNGGPGFSIGAKNEIHQTHSGEGSNIVHLGKPPFVLTPDMIADTVLKIAGRDARVMTIGDKSIGDAFRVALTQCGVNIISGKFSGHTSSGSNNFAGPIEVIDMGGIVDVTLDMTK